MESMSEKTRMRLESICPSFSVAGFTNTGMSAKRDVLLANETTLLYRYSERLYCLATEYGFDPHSPAFEPFRNSFDKIKIISVQHSLLHNEPLAPVHDVPEWLLNFKNVDCLYLDNIDVQNVVMLRPMKLKFLGILNAKVNYAWQFVQLLGKLNTLEFLMCSSVLSQRHLDDLKKILPEITTLRPG